MYVTHMQGKETPAGKLEAATLDRTNASCDHEAKMEDSTAGQQAKSVTHDFADASDSGVWVSPKIAKAWEDRNSPPCLQN